MLILPNRNRSNSRSKTYGEVGYSETVDKQFFEELKKQADSVSLVLIFRQYGIRCDEINKKTICPFEHHKGGAESSPSFYYYPESNSFWCFGCKTGGKFAHGCEFVSAMEGISKAKAAYRILKVFGDEASGDLEFKQVNYSEKMKILIDFSEMIRPCFITYSNNEIATKFLNSITDAFDKMNSKYNLDNEALKVLILKLKEKIEDYFICQQQ